MAGKPPKPISTLGVVLHHVITSLICVPILTGLFYLPVVFAIGLFIRLFHRSTDEFALPISLVAVIIATYVAAFNSLSNLKSRYLIAQPRACILPSILAFGGVMGGFCLIWIKSTALGTRLDYLYIIASCGISVLVFCWTTRRTLLKLSASEPRGFEVQTVLPVDPPE